MKRKLILVVALALVALIIAPAAVLADTTNVTGTVAGPTITVNAPAGLSFGTFKTGSNIVADNTTSGTQGSVVITLNSANTVNWQVTAVDSTNLGYMKNGSTPLFNKLSISASNGSWVLANTGINYTGTYSTGSPFSFYSNQTIDMTHDTAGSYSITITFTATISSYT